MRWFRVHASRIGTAAVVTLAALVVSAAVPHDDDCHDTACQAAAVEHDSSAHRLAAPAGVDEHGFHCLVCHWARSFRPRSEPRVLATPISEPGITIRFECFTAAITAPAAQPPLRSPPSSPNLA